MIDILMITHNRLEYLKKALPSVLGQGNLIIWDNGSDDETVEWLRKQKLYVYFNDDNINLAEATSYVFSNSKAEFVGKVDSDMIIPPDWAKRLIAKHKEAHYGFLGGFHFNPLDLEYIKPLAPIIKNGVWEKHHIGGQFVIRREDFKGYKGKGVMGLTEYQEEMGLINGYLWDPIMWVDHFEDARSPNHIGNEEYNQYKLKTRGISLAEYQGSIANQTYLKENTYQQPI